MLLIINSIVQNQFTVAIIKEKYMLVIQLMILMKIDAYQNALHHHYLLQLILLITAIHKIQLTVIISCNIKLQSIINLSKIINV